MEVVETLKELSQAYGPSGQEESVCHLIKSMVENYADELTEDEMGNLYVIKKGKSPKILISAHMDEIGVIVTDIDENGFLRIAPVGGIKESYLIGQRVRFKNQIVGVVYNEALNGKEKVEWSKMYVDIGAEGKDTAGEIIRVGDLACSDQPFVKLYGRRYAGKAMDNRAGCAVLVELIKRLPDKLPVQVCFLFSTQEELGLRGAKIAAFRYEPDYGLAVDVTMVGDTPKSSTMAVHLGKGPAIKVKDKSIMTDTRLRRMMERVAEENLINYQLEVLTMGGTDAGAIHLSRKGVPSGAISIPCRYIHSPSEVVSGEDLDGAVNLLEKLILTDWKSLLE